MGWTIEYYEQADTTQPAEAFEDALDHTQPRLAAKLARFALELETYGPKLGGGYLETCHGYAGLWELRAIYSQWLARELLGFDQDRVVLLHGYLNRGGEPASKQDLTLAWNYWQDYLRTRKISLEEQEDVE